MGVGAKLLGLGLVTLGLAVTGTMVVVFWVSLCVSTWELVAHWVSALESLWKPCGAFWRGCDIIRGVAH